MAIASRTRSRRLLATIHIQQTTTNRDRQKSCVTRAWPAEAARFPPASAEWLQAFVDGQAFTQWLEQRLAPRQTPELEVARARARARSSRWLGLGLGLG